MTRANWTSATAWPDRPPPFHPWKLFFKAYPTKSLSLPLYPTIFSLYPPGLSHSLSAYDALRQAGRADNAPGAIRRAESQAGEKCRMKHRALRQAGRAKRALRPIAGRTSSPCRTAWSWPCPGPGWPGSGCRGGGPGRRRAGPSRMPPPLRRSAGRRSVRPGRPC